MKTLLITGASRGIGQAIALRFAKAQYQVAIFTKDHPDVIAQTTEQIRVAGGVPYVLEIDVTDTKQLQEAVSQVVAHFGRIDALIHNTSAAFLTDTLHTTPERFDLMIGTSVRAAFFLSQMCIPSLSQSPNPHIVHISPPLNLDPVWFKDHLAFSIAKYAMSFCTLGLSAEFKNIAVNSLWPQTTIATKTLQELLSPSVYEGSRWPTIMGDAAFELISRKTSECSGHFFIDEDLLREAGKTDFSSYVVNPAVPLTQPLFIPLKKGMTPISKEFFLQKES